MSFAPRFSPDNKKIIFSLTKRGSSNIFVQKLSNNETIQITNNRHINTSPSFSPDNKWIVFSSDRSGNKTYILKKAMMVYQKKQKELHLVVVVMQRLCGHLEVTILLLLKLIETNFLLG